MGNLHLHHIASRHRQNSRKIFFPPPPSRVESPTVHSARLLNTQYCEVEQVLLDFITTGKVLLEKIIYHFVVLDQPIEEEAFWFQ